MIIVDKNSKTISEISWEKITNFEWNRDEIHNVVEKNYVVHDFLENTYINYLPCFNKYNWTKALTIISLTHKKVFVVNRSLSNKLSASTVVWRLLGFSPYFLKKIHKEYSIVLYDKLAIPWFKTVKITNMEDLYRHCIWLRIRKENDFWKSTARLTLEYMYQKKRGFEGIKSSIWSGISSLKKIAIAKSISEALERFSAGVVPKENRIDNLQISKSISEFFVWKHPTKKHDKLFPIVHLINKQKLLVAWNLLFYPYEPDPNRNASSNGMSCHITRSLAIENGLFELIERDAFVLSWLLKSWIYCIKKTKKIENLIQKFDLQNYDVQLFVMHFDNPVPVVLCIVKDWQKISTSLGIGYTLNDAINKSLNESGQFWKQNIEIDPDFKSDDSLIELHIKHYVDESNYHKISWYYSLPLISISQAQDLFKPIRNDKELIGYYDSIWTNLYSYEYKNPILTYYKRHCMRVISDNLLHIWFWEGIPSSILNSDRLRYRKEKLSIQSLNTEIHPFG